MPQISVIVPVYNVEPYIRRCVDSILVQTFTDFELILVDDGSPDNCPTICDEYAVTDSRVHVIHQENGGLSAARNAGIDWAFANSDSQWLTFIDSDDWIPKRYLDLLLYAAQEFDTKISMCWLYPTAGSTPDLSHYNLKAMLRNPEQAYTLNGKEISAYAQGRLYAKECFESIRFPVGKLFEDVFTTHKIIFNQEKISVIEAPIYFYYINPEGIVNSSWSMKKMDVFDAMEQQIDYFECNGYDLARRMQIRRYLTGIKEKIALLSKNEESNKDVLSALRGKKSKNFSKYSKQLNINDEADAWVLTQIYPKRMWVYWHWHALKQKLNRISGNCR